MIIKLSAVLFLFCQLIMGLQGELPPHPVSGDLHVFTSPASLEENITNF